MFDKIISHSESGIPVLRRRYLQYRKNVSYLPHPVYSDWYSNNVSQEEARHELNLPEGKRIFLFFGLIRRYKGIDLLLEALRMLPNENLLVMIAGDPVHAEVREEIERAAEKDPRIKTIFRIIEDNEIEYLFNAADIVVLPFRKIFSSGSMMLALTFGKPVIAPDMFSCRDLIDERKGFLFEPGSATSLRDAMQESLAVDLTSFSEENLAFAKQDRTWERYADAVLN